MWLLAETRYIAGITAGSFAECMDESDVLSGNLTDAPDVFLTRDTPWYTSARQVQHSHFTLGGTQ